MAEQADSRLSYSIEEFCAATRISRRTFYSLMEKGNGPKTITVGRRRLVSVEAAQAWLRNRE